MPFVLAITYEERTVLRFAVFVHKENACFPMCYKGFYTINALFFFQLEFVLEFPCLMRPDTLFNIVFNTS